MLRSLGKQDIRRRGFGRNVRGHLGARLGNGGVVVIIVLLVIDGKAGAESLTCRTLGGLDSVRNNGNNDHKILMSINRAAGVSCRGLLRVNCSEKVGNTESKKNRLVARNLSPLTIER